MRAPAATALKLTFSLRTLEPPSVLLWLSEIIAITSTLTEPSSSPEPPLTGTTK